MAPATRAGTRADLEHERHEERYTARTEAGQDIPADAHGEGARAENRQPDKRGGMPPGMADVQSEQGYAADEQYGREKIGADPVAEDFKAAGKGNELRPNRKSPSSRRGGAKP